LISKNFIKSSVIYTLAGALPMASAVLLLPFYLDYLSPKEFGVLSLYLSAGILAQLIITLGFDSSIYLHYHDFKNDEKRLPVFVSSAFTAILVSGMVVSGLMLLAGGPLFRAIFSNQSVPFFPYGFLSIVTAIGQSLFKVNNSLLQIQEKPVVFLWSNMVSFFLTALFTIVGLRLYPDTLIGPVGGRMLAFVISGMWAMASVYGTFGFHFSFPTLKQVIPFNTYQFIYLLQQWVINYFDRFILALLVVMSDLGVYDFTIKCLLVIDFVIGAMVNSFLPKILKQSSAQTVDGSSIVINRYYNGLTAVIMLMVSGTILVLPILMTWYVTYATKPGYLSSAQLVPWASLVFLLRGMRYFFSLPYNVQKDSKPLPVIFLIVSAVKVVMSYFLILRWGLYGAIFATLISSGFEIVLFWSWKRNQFHFFFNPLKLIGGPVFLMAVILLIEPWAKGQWVWQVHLFYAILTTGLLLWLYRKEIVLIDLKKIFSS
jgi:O-antigen/teichoic acid export membrane protein